MIWCINYKEKCVVSYVFRHQEDASGSVLYRPQKRLHGWAENTQGSIFIIYSVCVSGKTFSAIDFWIYKNQWYLIISLDKYKIL